MTKLKRARSACLALIAYAGLSSAAHAGQLEFFKVAQDILRIDLPGSARLVHADVDGDGLQDVIFCGVAGSPALFVLGRLQDGSIGLKQTEFVPETGDVVRVLSATVDNALHVYLVANDGVVRDFSGWPLQQRSQFSVPVNVNAAAIGDLYGNGNSNLVLLAGSNHLYAYALESGTQLWSYAVDYAYDLVLAQLDGDPALEIVLNSPTGLVIDGATQATDWQYGSAFGYALATGNFNGDSSSQFVAAGNSNFSVYSGAPWSPLWTAGNSPDGIAGIATANFDSNGYDVIMYGDAQNGAVHVFDSATHQERFQITNAGSDVHGIAAADLDGDSVPEIAFTSMKSYADWQIKIVDSVSRQLKWSLVSQQGTFSPVAIGDVDGDGQPEMVVANTAQSAYGPGTIEILDAATGALKWQSPSAAGNGNNPFYMSAARVLLVPHQNDSAQDIVLAGYATYDGRITVIDGATHDVKLNIYSYSSGPMSSYYVEDAALLDYDNDGILDIAVALQWSASGNAAQLQVFSGTDGHQLWASEQMNTGAGLGPIRGLVATGSGADPGSLLIAVLPAGLRAYGIQSKSLAWTLAGPADGAIVLPPGAAGDGRIHAAQVAVFQHSGAVSVYDLASQQVRRNLTLPAPLNALLLLDGNTLQALAAAGNSLKLVDLQGGTVLASSPYLGAGLASGNNLAAATAGNSRWDIASGNMFGVFHHRLEVDEIFAGGFENQVMSPVLPQ